MFAFTIWAASVASGIRGSVTVVTLELSVEFLSISKIVELSLSKCTVVLSVKFALVVAVCVELSRIFESLKATSFAKTIRSCSKIAIMAFFIMILIIFAVHLMTKIKFLTQILSTKVETGENISINHRKKFFLSSEFHRQVYKIHWVV